MMDLRYRLRRRGLLRTGAVASVFAMASMVLLPASRASAEEALPDQTAAAPVWVGGKQLYQSVVDPETNTVYVAAYGNSVIYLYDGASGGRKGRFDLPGTGPMGLALNGTTNTLYVTSARDETVQALEAGTGRVKAIIRQQPGTQSREVRVDEAANRFYVSETHESDLGHGMLAEYDGVTNTLLRRIPTNGSWASGLALDTERKLAYVTNVLDHNLVVIDLATGTVVRQVATGTGSRPTGLAFDPATKHLFITLQGFGTVEILDTVTGRPIGAPVSTGVGPLGVSVDSAKGRAYVTNYGANTLSVLDASTGAKVYDVANVGDDPIVAAVNTSTHDVWVIAGGRDSTSDTVTKIVPGAGSARISKQMTFGEVSVHATVVDPVTNTVYLADLVNSTVCAYDGATGKQSRRIQVPQRPTDLAINFRTSTVYATDATARGVQVIDLNSGLVKATLDVSPGSAKEVRVDEKANRVYVTVTDRSARSGSVLEFDGASSTLVRRIPTDGRTATGLALDPDARRAYVTTVGSDAVAVINLATGKVDRQIHTGPGSRPTELAFNPKTKRIYVTLQGSGRVVTIDAVTYLPVGPPVASGVAPFGVAVDVEYGRVYVTNSRDGTMSVLDATTGVKLSTVAGVGHAPASVAVNTTTHEVWVTAGGLPGRRDTLTKVSAPAPVRR